MKYEDLKVRLTGNQAILGGVPLDTEVYSKFLKGKMIEKEAKLINADKDLSLEEKSLKLKELEEQVLKDEGQLDEDLYKDLQTTGFYRDNEGIILKAYQIKGFFKSAADVLKNELKLKQVVSKIDKFVFVLPNDIKLMKNGVQVIEPDDILERPLRAQTMQGPRVSLARSEAVEDWSLEFTVRVLANSSTEKSSNFTIDTIRELLNYGMYNGLLQWRNAGYGSFTWEEIK